jgi:hypothetical protein
MGLVSHSALLEEDGAKAPGIVAEADDRRPTHIGYLLTMPGRAAASISAD